MVCQFLIKKAVKAGLDNWIKLLLVKRLVSFSLFVSKLVCTDPFLPQLVKCTISLWPKEQKFTALLLETQKETFATVYMYMRYGNLCWKLVWIVFVLTTERNLHSAIYSS